MVGEEGNGFLKHGRAEGGEFREVAVALFVERFEVIEVKPGGGEFSGHAACAFVAQHPAGLFKEGVGIFQLAARRDGKKFGVGC